MSNMVLSMLLLLLVVHNGSQRAKLLRIRHAIQILCSSKQTPTVAGAPAAVVVAGGGAEESDEGNGNALPTGNDGKSTLVVLVEKEGASPPYKEEDGGNPEGSNCNNAGNDMGASGITTGETVEGFVIGAVGDFAVGSEL